MPPDKALLNQFVLSLSVSLVHQVCSSSSAVAFLLSEEGVVYFLFA